ncbi:hypothetical protein [Natrialba chahannaoensis]|uniref:hypothetical protein n=1 Tax=Natrialba chahannaoensis TaxID=68911 RepID=UPI0012681111|nr:hypothetical protein [Natrialba chahannaoensis]
MKKTIILLIIGLVLILNPVYLYSSGGGIEYNYKPIELNSTDSVENALVESDRVVECPGNRVCELEQEALVDNSSNNIRQSQYESPYDVVKIDDGWYITIYDPNDQGSQLKEVTAMEAAKTVATPAGEYSTTVQTAIENDEHTVYGKQIAAYERGEVVEYNEDIYLITIEESRHWTQENSLSIVRILLISLGSFTMIFATLWRENR